MKNKFNLLKKLTAFIFLMIFLAGASLNAQSLNEFLRSNLYVVQNGSPVLIDGNLTHYHNSNSNSVDFNDAWKMTNPGENFGILRDGVTLAVERRKIFGMTDTTYYKIWNLRQQSYMIELISSNLNHPNVSAFIVDQYLNKRIPVNCNGTTRCAFEVNADPRSYDQARFKVIFRYNNPANNPVRIIGIRLLSQPGRTTRIEWDVEKEMYIEQFEIQKSADGISFETIDVVVPFNEGDDKTYFSLDNNCLEESYYRIKGITLKGEEIFSGVARLKPVADVNEIFIYPNPVTNKEAQLYLNEPLPGNYRILLFGTNGGLRARVNMTVREGQNLNKVRLPENINPGIYLMQIIRPDNSKVTKTISVL